MFYESATAFHGRLTPMRGRDYGSIFVHYTPEDWTWKTTHLNAAIPYDVDFSVIEPPQSAAWIPPEVEKQLTGKTTSRSVGRKARPQRIHPPNKKNYCGAGSENQYA